MKNDKKKSVKTVDWGYRWFVIGFFGFVILSVGLMINIAIKDGVGASARLARRL